MNLRELEHNSIRDFVASAAESGYLSGRVLDYGCGKQPYRLIVEANGGEYHGWDRSDLPAYVGGDPGGLTYPLEMKWGAILCTQVVQYVPNHFFRDDDGDGLPHLLRQFYWSLRESTGHLVLTYPTNWPEVEPEDLHRFTKAGMERLLTEAGFEIVKHEPRGFARFSDEGYPRRLLSEEWLALGYGVIARA